MRIIKDKVVWIDILKPNRGDLEFLKKKHKFHPIILDELLHPGGRLMIHILLGLLQVIALDIDRPDFDAARELDLALTQRVGVQVAKRIDGVPKRHGRTEARAIVQHLDEDHQGTRQKIQTPLAHRCVDAGKV